MKAKKFLIVLIAIFIGFSPFPSKAAPVFTDVSQGDWYFTYVTNLAGIGAISGYPDGSFKPDALISRVEFATVVMNTFGKDSIKSAVRAVSKSETERIAEENGSFWGNDTILAASYYKLADFGYSAKEWQKPATRAEMASMAVTAAEILGAQELKALEGIERAIADWSVVALFPERLQIQKAYSNGILVGKDETGTYDPEGNATRAQACVIVMRLAVPSLRAAVVIPEPDIYDLDDPNRGDAREGMSLADGTVLRMGKSGVLAEGQELALDLGRRTVRGREVRENSQSDGQMSGSRLGEPYLKSTITDEMHWRSDWLKIFYAYPKPQEKAQPGDTSPDSFYIYIDDEIGWKFCVSF